MSTEYLDMYIYRLILAEHWAASSLGSSSAIGIRVHMNVLWWNVPTAYEVDGYMGLRGQAPGSAPSQ